MNRTAGKMSSNSAAAVARLIVFMNHFVLQSEVAVNRYFAEGWTNCYRSVKAPGRFLHRFCSGLTILLQLCANTASVIPPNRQKLSFKLTLDSTYMVEIAFPEDFQT